MLSNFKRVGARLPKPNPNSDPKLYARDSAHQDRVQWGPFKGRRALEEDEK